MVFDLVVRNGTVVDGSGLAPYRADVGVTGDRIARIGRITERGRVELDAEGQVVTPGFIDGHTHMDAQVMWDPLGSCSCWHGVTSVVMGNCGFTLAPGASADRALVVRNLERAEDISAEAMAAGIDWTWDSYGEYLAAVSARPKGINYAGYVGHSALRTWAMGERAFTEEAAEDDLVKMEGGLSEALRAGAIGFSTSRSASHETSDARPVASRVASWNELSRLVSHVGANGGGLFEIAQESAASSLDPNVRNEALARMRELAVRSGVTMTFGIGGGTWRAALDSLEQTASDGGRAFGQAHSRGVSLISSFRTRLPFDRLSEWSGIRKQPLSEQRRALTDPETRKRLVYAAHHGDYGRSVGAEARAPDFAMITVLERGLPPNPNLKELADSRGVDPVELMIDLALATDFNQLFSQAIFASDDTERDLLAVMKHPRTVMTFSDSGAHVSQIMDSSIQTHLLGHWVRNKQAFTLEEAVQMITMAPALAFGFARRGLLAEGMIADINVFDPDQVGPGVPTIADDLPGGSRRLLQRSTGFLATIVAGEIVIKDGEHTGALPGRVVRGPLAAAQPASAG